MLDDYGDNRLTLTACHPKYSARQRIIVAAELVATPTPPSSTTVAPSTTDPAQPAPGSTVQGPHVDEGLGGDAGARTSAILWGLLFFALLAAVAVAARRWKRWPAYGLGLIVLLPVLYVWFENVDRWMPAR